MSHHIDPDSNNTVDKKGVSTSISSKKRIILSFVIVIGILMLAMGFYLKVRYSPDRCVKQFISALDTQDYQTLKSFITCDNVEITEESLMPFVDLYHTNSQFRLDIKNTLNHDLSKVDLDSYNTDSWIKLVPHRKFLVKTYTVVVEPILVTFSSNLTPVTITYSNTSLLLDNSASNDPVSLLPGLYQCDASYQDEARNKEINISNSVSLYSDQNIPLNFDCSTLVLELPQGYEFNSLTTDGTDLSADTQIIDGKLQCFPVFLDEILTLSCENPWKDTVTTSFTIPEEYRDKIYDYALDFNSTSMKFDYEPGLEVVSIKRNGKELSNISAFDVPKKHSVSLSDLCEDTTIDIVLEAPWGEKFSYNFQVSEDNFDEYEHVIRCPLSEKTKKAILDCALNYYMNLFEALNNDDLETLTTYADDDEMASDFCIMLENIEYDYTTYADQFFGFEEDILLEPKVVLADKTQLENYNDVIELNLFGNVESTSTSMSEDYTSPVVEADETEYNVLLHIVYDLNTNKWKVNAGFYEYNTYHILDPVKLY